MKKNRLLVALSVVACLAIAGGTTALMAIANTNSELQFSLDGTIGESYAVKSELNLPQGKYIKGNDEFIAETIVYCPNGYGYETQELTLDVHGQYTVQYRAKIDGQWQIQEYTFFTKKNQYDFNNEKSIATYGEDQTIWNVGSKEAGLYISLQKDDVFTYNEPINVRDLEGESFIKFNLLPNVVGVSDAATMHIQLVDAYDENNYIDWQCSLGSGAWGYQTHKAKANGQSYVGIEYWNNQMVHIGNAYGSYLTWAPGGNVETMTTDSQQLFYIVSDNSLWSSLDHESGRICDFDATYQANPWTGFASDYAYVRIYAESYVGDTFNILVNKIGNVDLSKNDFIDMEGPVIEVDTNEMSIDDLPNAIVGKEYKIFDSTAMELCVGERPVSKRVYFNYARESGVYTTKCNDFYYELDTKGGRFTPDAAGKYSIVYSATDYLGNYTEKVITISAVATESVPIVIQLDNCVVEQKIGSKTNIGDIVSIENAIFEMEISRNVLYGEEKLPVYGNDISGYYFIPSNVGTYTVVVAVKDMIGNEGEFRYDVQIMDSTDPVFETDPVLPLYYIQGEEYEIKALKVKDLSTNSYVNADITIIDGLGERNYSGGKTSFIPNEDGVVIVRYTSGTNMKEHEVPVVSVKNGEDLDISKYFQNTAGGLEIKGDPLGILLTSRNTDGEVTFIKPLLQNGLEIALRTDAEHSDYEFITVTLQDSVDASQKVKIAIKKTAKGSNAEVWYNGEKTKITVANPFYNSVTFNIKYDYKTNRISDGNSAGVELTKTVLGKEFKGFTSGEVYITIGLEGIHSRSNLYISSINGQRINGDIIEDNIAPDAYLLGIYEDRYLPINSTITVYPMVVGDVLSNITYSSVSVTHDNTPVLSNNGKVLSNVDISGTYEFDLKKAGKYTVKYIVKDSAGKETVRTYQFEIIDVEAPVIQGVSMPTEGVVGELIKIPTTTAMDETDGEVKVTIYVIYPDLTVRVLTNTKYFTFIQAGTYIVRYMAIDAMGNTSYMDYEIIAR